jgi:hypothetical protein
MKDFRVKELDKFIEIANNIETPFKFYEIEGRILTATINMRTFLISYEGIADESTISKLKENGFAEVSIRETKKFVLEGLP